MGGLSHLININFRCNLIKIFTQFKVFFYLFQLWSKLFSRYTFVSKGFIFFYLHRADPLSLLLRKSRAAGLVESGLSGSPHPPGFCRQHLTSNVPCCLRSIHFRCSPSAYWLTGWRKTQFHDAQCVSSLTEWFTGFLEKTQFHDAQYVWTECVMFSDWTTRQDWQVFEMQLFKLLNSLILKGKFTDFWDWNLSIDTWCGSSLPSNIQPTCRDPFPFGPGGCFPQSPLDCSPIAQGAHGPWIFAHIWAPGSLWNSWTPSALSTHQLLTPCCNHGSSLILRLMLSFKYSRVLVPPGLGITPGDSPWCAFLGLSCSEGFLH